MIIRALDVDIDPSSYQSHPLHQADREWSETNCYVDLWIEIMSALHFEPLAAGMCTFASDFEGDQWTMFKFSTEDLWMLFGIEVTELNVWRPLIEHAIEQLSFGRLLNVDVDSWYLPDTAGNLYQLEHQKTTLSLQMIDADAHRLGYFHNAGYYELEGTDFDGILGLGDAPGEHLPPYVEVVKLDRRHVEREPDLRIVKRLVGQHLARRPVENPMRTFHRRLEADRAWLVQQDLSVFHRYAFGTCRQCGSNAELAADFTEWLDERDGGGLAEVSKGFRTIASCAKSLQFALARAQRGRAVAFDDLFDQMAAAWEMAMKCLVERYG